MSLKTELPHRKPLRLAGWDYSSPGWYFVTICVQDMRPVFGAVVNGKMVLNNVGRMAHEMWRVIEHFHPEYHLDECVIMPNHVHGLVRLDTGRPNDLPLRAGLPDFVRRYKSTVDVAWRKMAGAGRCACPSGRCACPSGRCACPSPDAMRNGKLWHRNYWDVIVHDAQALENIRNYIRFNPMNYHVVMNCGEPKHLGNRSLLFAHSRIRASLPTNELTH